MRGIAFKKRVVMCCCENRSINIQSDWREGRIELLGVKEILSRKVRISNYFEMEFNVSQRVIISPR